MFTRGGGIWLDKQFNQIPSTTELMIFYNDAFIHYRGLKRNIKISLYRMCGSTHKIIFYVLQGRQITTFHNAYWYRYSPSITGTTYTGDDFYYGAKQIYVRSKWLYDNKVYLIHGCVNMPLYSEVVVNRYFVQKRSIDTFTYKYRLQ